MLKLKYFFYFKFFIFAFLLYTNSWANQNSSLKEILQTDTVFKVTLPKKQFFQGEIIPIHTSTYREIKDKTYPISGKRYIIKTTFFFTNKYSLKDNIFSDSSIDKIDLKNALNTSIYQNKIFKTDQTGTNINIISLDDQIGFHKLDILFINHLKERVEHIESYMIQILPPQNILFNHFYKNYFLLIFLMIIVIICCNPRNSFLKYKIYLKIGDFSSLSYLETKSTILKKWTLSILFVTVYSSFHYSSLFLNLCLFFLCIVICFLIIERRIIPFIIINIFIILIYNLFLEYLNFKNSYEVLFQQINNLNLYHQILWLILFLFSTGLLFFRSNPLLLLLIFYQIKEQNLLNNHDLFAILVLIITIYMFIYNYFQNKIYIKTVMPKL